MKTVDECVKILADKSKTDNHELIEECLIFYGSWGTKDLLLNQIQSYIKEKELV